MLHTRFFDLQLFAEPEPTLTNTGATGTSVSTEEASAAPEGTQPTQPQTQEEKDWKAEFERLSKDYKRLERRLTKETQKAAEYRPALELYQRIQSAPELAEQIQSLLETYSQQSDPAARAAAELAAEKAVLEVEVAAAKLRAEDPVFREHEEEIVEYAEENDIPITSPRDVLLVYKAWKGENADRLALEAQRAAAEAARQKRKEGALLGGGTGANKTAPMTDEEFLAARKLKLWTDD